MIIKIGFKSIVVYIPREGVIQRGADEVLDGGETAVQSRSGQVRKINNNIAASELTVIHRVGTILTIQEF